MATVKNKDKFVWKPGDVQIYKNIAEAEKATGMKLVKPRPVSKGKKK